MSSPAEHVRRREPGALREPGDSVLLTGLMGCGKTSVGHLLAARLAFEFIDTDDRVVSIAGISIAEIFAREGEAGFRARERDVLRALPRVHAVVALGGGAVVPPENRALLEGLGTRVWLEAEPETLAARVGPAAGRPLLAGLDARGRLARLRELLEVRHASYASAAVRVATDGKSAAQVCDDVLEGLARAEGRA
jgi:shikimate kinase